jgi:flagellar assembly factor FliW
MTTNQALQNISEANTPVDTISSDAETLNTRFGTVMISRENPIVFPIGLLGMPDKFHFCLAEFPDDNLEQFKLLQSLDDEELSFITLPVDLQNPIVEETDIKAACQDLGISENSMAMLLIVSVHRGPGDMRLSVNARAPLFIDTERRLAQQYVFRNDKYKVQHMITA